MITVSDNELLRFIACGPADGVRFHTICRQFDIPWVNPHGENGYSPDARHLRNQLRRLQRQALICQARGQKWITTLPESRD